MKVAIFGSLMPSTNHGGGIVNPEAMSEFCFRLGTCLAGLPHVLLVESDHPRTADRHVISGMLSVRPNPGARIWVYHRTSRRVHPPFAAEAANAGDLFLFKPYSDHRLNSSHLRMLREADLAIVVGGGADSYAAGLAASLMGVRLLPVATFGGSGRLLWQELSDQLTARMVKRPLRHTWERMAGDPRLVIEVIRQELATLPRIMIVHGRSHDRRVVQGILRDLGVQRPIVLQETFSPGQTIPERFEREALQADGALVLFTPDDEAATLLDPNGQPVSAVELRSSARARQNVSLEYGWFWGRLGRERVLLLIKGKLELPSDLAGLHYESYADSPDECRTSIADFIEGIRAG